jgi:tRNA threonylcarbamoyl adenosine modification protein YjeE
LTESIFSLRDIAATERLARAFAASIGERAIIALNGPLGVGKTKFVQLLAAAMEVEELVNSPTFTMMNEYHSGRLPLYHFDLYRLSEGQAALAAEMLDSELAEILVGNYLIVIEWAELLEKPELSETNFLRGLDHLTAQFSYNEVQNENPIKESSSLYKEDQARLVRMHPCGPGSVSILQGVLTAVPELAL